MVIQSIGDKVHSSLCVEANITVGLPANEWMVLLPSPYLCTKILHHERGVLFIYPLSPHAQAERALSTNFNKVWNCLHRINLYLKKHESLALE